MELVFAAVLATLFVLVTAAFHVPERFLDRRPGSRRIVRDLPDAGR